jgi:diguanylate cyclase (GGDEF)-like protein
VNYKAPIPDSEQPFLFEERRTEPRDYEFHYDIDSEHELSGLPGRAALIEALTNAASEIPGRFGVIFIDLDGLKELNDTAGHEEGDRYLQFAADVLHEDTSRKDIVATATEQGIVAMATHLAGDEYVVAVANVHTEKQLAAVRDRLHIALDDLGVPNSMGSKLHAPGELVGDLIKAADELMYAHKLERKLAALTPEQRLGLLAIDRIAKEHGISLRDAPTTIAALYQVAGRAFGISFGEAPDATDGPDQETTDE